MQNRLLAALPRKSYGELLPALAPVQLAFGEVLNEPRRPIRHVYFPGDCVVSLVAPVDAAHALEVGMVGCEGVIGTPLVLGVADSPVRALVQRAGAALRIDAARFRRELARNAPLQRVLHRYIQALMAQITQTAACNRFHVIEPRLARWLLMTRDRVRSAQFRMTHEFLAQMLGVRRVGITEAAGALQRRSLIAYTRGAIRILDHRGLEAASCSCYHKSGSGSDYFHGTGSSFAGR